MRKTIHVVDLGADPSGRNPSGPAFQRALEEAVRTRAERISWPAGTYRIEGPADWIYALHLKSANGLRIAGEGERTRLIITNPAQGVLQLTECTNVTVSGFVIDYDPLPFTQGTIRETHIQDGYFELEVDPGFSGLDTPWFQKAVVGPQCWGAAIDRTTRLCSSEGPDHTYIQRWRHLGGRRWAIYPTEPFRSRLPFLLPGMGFVPLARGIQAQAMLVWSSSDCVMSDITVYASPACSLAIGASERITADGLRVLYHPSGDRLISTNADGLHCPNNRRGLVIRRCLCEGMMDDGINIYGSAIQVAEVLDARRIVTRGRPPLSPGDRLQIVRPQDGAVLGVVTLDRVEQSPEGPVLTFQQPVEGLRAGADHQTADTLYNLSQCGNGYRIEDNTFRRHRGRSILLRAGDGLVTRNRIDDPSSRGIVLSNEPDWPEGPIPANITIQDNVITGGCYGLWTPLEPLSAMIMIRAARLGHRPAEVPAASRIRVLRNRIIDSPVAGISAAAVSDLLLADNRIESDPAKPRGRQAAGVECRDCRNVRVRGLNVRDRREGTLAALQTERCDGVVTERLAGELPPGAPMHRRPDGGT